MGLQVGQGLAGVGWVSLNGSASGCGWSGCASRLQVGLFSASRVFLLKGREDLLTVDHQNTIHRAKSGVLCPYISPKLSGGQVAHQWVREVHTTHVEGQGNNHLSCHRHAVLSLCP